MDNVQTTGQQIYAFASACISVGTGGFAAITPQVELWVRVICAIIAGISGLMAIRYYHFATKEKLQALKNSKTK